MDEYQLEFSTDFGRSFQNCPACQKELIASAQECLSCGVVITRVQDRQYLKNKQNTVGAIDHLSVGEIKQLDRRWKQVVVNYHDHQEHYNFINHCQRVGALPFAVHHYTQMLEVDSEDDIAELMRRQVLSRLTVKLETSKPVAPALAEIQPLLFVVLRWISALLLFTATAFITIGLLAPNQKNLVGLGVAFMALAYIAYSYRK